MMRSFAWEEPGEMKGSEMLMAIMGRFGDHGEPLAMLVVYTDINGDVWMKTNCTHTHAVGLATYAQQNILNAMLKQEEPS
jgi:hypothetical protein